MCLPFIPLLGAGAAASGTAGAAAAASAAGAAGAAGAASAATSAMTVGQALSAFTGIASTMLSIRGQQQQAKAMATAQDRAEDAERQRYLAEVDSLRTQQRLQQVAMSQKLQKAQVKTMEAVSTAETSALENLTSGVNVDALMANYYREQGNYNYSLQQQQTVNNINTAIAMDNATGRTQSRILQIQQPIAQPDYMGAALGGIQIGTASNQLFDKAGLFQSDLYKTT